MESVTVNIYDAYDQKVNAVTIDASNLKTGANSVFWNGKAANGTTLSDGLYYYTVQNASGEYISTEVSGTVAAIKTVNNTPYLVLADSGRLVSMAKVSEIY